VHRLLLWDSIATVVEGEPMARLDFEKKKK
jgi:hypothetical protein